MRVDNTIIIFPGTSAYHTTFYLIKRDVLFMIGNSSIKNSEKDSAICEEKIAKILDQAVKLFRRTDLPELADKWDRILNSYHSKKKFD